MSYTTNDGRCALCGEVVASSAHTCNPTPVVGAVSEMPETVAQEVLTARRHVAFHAEHATDPNPNPNRVAIAWLADDRERINHLLECAERERDEVRDLMVTAKNDRADVLAALDTAERERDEWKAACVAVCEQHEEYKRQQGSVFAESANRIIQEYYRRASLPSPEGNGND